MAKKEPNFEKQMERLQQIVDLLEDMDTPLSTNVALYKEGKTLAASCMQLLEQARHDVLQCDERGMTPFSIDTDDDEKTTVTTD